MIYVYHLFICFFLIIFQTTILADLPVHFYDLIAPFMVYLGVFRRPREAVFLAVFCGLIMDGISGGVFGVHLTVYIWMYVGVRWAIQFLQVGNSILLPLLVSGGIVFQSIIEAFAAVVLSSPTWPTAYVFSVVSAQVMWGIITGPVLMFLLVRGQLLARQAGIFFVVEKDLLRRS